MKKIILSVALATLTSVAFAADVEKKTVTTTEGGTTTTHTKTTVGTGTITEYTPGSTFIVKESSGPVTYRYGNSVTYVTRSGKTIPEAELKTRVRVGAPVHVHYTGEGEARVITRVEVDD